MFRKLLGGLALAALATAGISYDAGHAQATTYITWTQIKSYDGYCLSIPNANVGTRLDQVPCADAHGWWQDANHNLYPEGHANVQVGDSGGFLELKAAGTGTAIYDDGGILGPGGLSYYELFFGVPGTYWHANGNGLDVTFDSLSSDLANYWTFI